MRAVIAIRGFFSRNLGLKLAAFATALVLFSAVRGAEDAQRSVFVDVAASLPAPDTNMMLISQPPDQVRLTLRGSRSQINAVRPENLPPVVIDLTDPGQRYYYFADDDFDVPAGVTITQVAPTSIPLEWATRIERHLPVQPRLVGDPPDGLVLSQPARVDPGEVGLAGPEREVEPLRTIRTEPVSLAGLTVGHHALRIPLMRPPPHTRYLGEASVTVILDVVEDRAERTITGIVINTPEGVLVTPTHVSLLVQGPPRVLERIDPASLSASADPADLQPDGSLRVAVLGIPDGSHGAAHRTCICLAPAIDGGARATRAEGVNRCSRQPPASHEDKFRSMAYRVRRAVYHGLPLRRPLSEGLWRQLR